MGDRRGHKMADGRSAKIQKRRSERAATFVWIDFPFVVSTANASLGRSRRPLSSSVGIK